MREIRSQRSVDDLGISLRILDQDRHQRRGAIRLLIFRRYEYALLCKLDATDRLVIDEAQVVIRDVERVLRLETVREDDEQYVIEPDLLKTGQRERDISQRWIGYKNPAVTKTPEGTRDCVQSDGISPGEARPVMRSLRTITAMSRCQPRPSKTRSARMARPLVFEDLFRFSGLIFACGSGAANPI